MAAEVVLRVTVTATYTARLVDYGCATAEQAAELDNAVFKESDAELFALLGESDYTVTVTPADSMEGNEVLEPLGVLTLDDASKRDLALAAAIDLYGLSGLDDTQKVVDTAELFLLFLRNAEL